MLTGGQAEEKYGVVARRAREDKQLGTGRGAVHAEKRRRYLFVGFSSAIGGLAVEV